jgi:UDP-galactopyranose mutase
LITKVPLMTIVCFSHLRWDFVAQHPQQLTPLLAARYPIVFWEEPWIVAPECEARTETCFPADDIMVVVPHLPDGLDGEETTAALRTLLDTSIAGARQPLIRWYFTPMMLLFSRHLKAACTIYGCIDELATLRFAPPQSEMLDAELRRLADHVIGGDRSVYAANASAALACIPSSLERNRLAGANGGSRGLRPISPHVPSTI